MVELKHKNRTYYIEKITDINKYGIEQDIIYYIKRKRYLFKIEMPFWKYVSIEHCSYGGCYKYRKVFHSKEEAKEFFYTDVCKLVSSPYEKKELIQTLNCNNEKQKNIKKSS